MHKWNALPRFMRSVHLVIAVISMWLLFYLAPLCYKPRRLLGDSRNMHDFSRFSVAYVS